MKTGYVIMVCDHGIASRANRVEMLPFVFDSRASIDDYTDRRLNSKVTKVVQVIETQVDDQYELVHCSN